MPAKGQRIKLCVPTKKVSAEIHYVKEVEVEVLDVYNNGSSDQQRVACAWSSLLPGGASRSSANSYAVNGFTTAEGSTRVLVGRQQQQEYVWLPCKPWPGGNTKRRSGCWVSAGELGVCACVMQTCTHFSPGATLLT
jgi:hypothetical protein